MSKFVFAVDTDFFSRVVDNSFFSNINAAYEKAISLYRLFKHGEEPVIRYYGKNGEVYILREKDLPEDWLDNVLSGDGFESIQIGYANFDKEGYAEEFFSVIIICCYEVLDEYKPDGEE